MILLNHGKATCTSLLPCRKKNHMRVGRRSLIWKTTLVLHFWLQKLTGRRTTAASRDGKSLIIYVCLLQLMRNTSKMWRWQQQWPGLGPMLKSGEMGCQGAGGTWETGWWPRGERSRRKTGWKVTFGSVDLANIETDLNYRREGWWRDAVGSWRKFFSFAYCELFAAWL